MSNSGTGMSYTHSYKLADKDRFSDQFISALEEVDFTDKEFKQSFITPYFKQLIKSDIDLAMVSCYDHHSIIVESIHRVFQDTVLSDATLGDEVSQLFKAVYKNIISNISPFIFKLRNSIVELRNPPTNIHNEHQKTINVINSIYLSIKNKETTYTQSFDILYEYLFLQSTLERSVTHWFHPGILLVNNLRVLSSPSISSIKFNSPAVVKNAISGIAFSSVVMTPAFQTNKRSIRDLSHIHSLSSLNRRTFKKCLDAVDLIIKNPINEGISSQAIFSLVIPVLDKIIDDRLAKKQLFGN